MLVSYTDLLVSQLKLCMVQLSELFHVNRLSLSVPCVAIIAILRLKAPWGATVESAAAAFTFTHIYR